MCSNLQKKPLQTKLKYMRELIWIYYSIQIQILREFQRGRIENVIYCNYQLPLGKYLIFLHPLTKPPRELPENELFLKFLSNHCISI